MSDTRFIVCATMARDRYFDLDSVRQPFSHYTIAHEGSKNASTKGAERAASGGRRFNITENRITNPAGAPPLDWWLIDDTYTAPERTETNVSTARYIIGDTRQVLADMEPGSVDLILTSPPFLALRSYLPQDHPQKHLEMGSEPTPADFLDGLLDVVELCRRVLAPHGTLCFELGDTYAGSGGGGGDYSDGGMRDGQPKFDGSGQRIRATRREGFIANGIEPPKRRDVTEGWPLDKSLTGIPTLFAWSLAYGRNLLRPERTIEPWRIRNLICWSRPNPPVGALGDKFRPATSYMTVATLARDRYFDLDAVRTPVGPVGGQTVARGKPTGSRNDDNLPHYTAHHPAGAPPLDWWEPLPEEQALWDQWADELWTIPTAPYKGSHYATWPSALCVRPIKAMCPERVCLSCGEPSRRLVNHRRNIEGADLSRKGTGRSEAGLDGGPLAHWSQVSVTRDDIGWSHCACGTGCRPTTWRTDTVETVQVKVDGAWLDADEVGEVPDDAATRTKRKRKQIVDDVGSCADPSHWRRGVVLDPFAGSGTTLAVATGHGRDALGIDLDESNVELARQRVGPLYFEEVVHRAPKGRIAG